MSVLFRNLERGNDILTDFTVSLIPYKSQMQPLDLKPYFSKQHRPLSILIADKAKVKATEASYCPIPLFSGARKR